MIGRNIRSRITHCVEKIKIKKKVWHSSHYITDISRFLKEHTNKLKYVTVLFTKQHVYCTLWLWLKEGLGCGIRTWDLVTWDSGTWDSGTWDSGTWDARTQGRGTRGRAKIRGRDKQTTPDICAEFVENNFLRNCSSFLILFWVFCVCHKITTVTYFFWTIFTGFLPVG